MKNNLGLELFCQAAEIFMYSDEEIRRDLPAEEAEDLIRYRDSLIASVEHPKKINFAEWGRDRTAVAAEEPEGFNE